MSINHDDEDRYERITERSIYDVYSDIACFDLNNPNYPEIRQAAKELYFHDKEQRTKGNPNQGDLIQEDIFQIITVEDIIHTLDRQTSLFINRNNPDEGNSYVDFYGKEMIINPDDIVKGLMLVRRFFERRGWSESA